MKQPKMKYSTNKTDVFFTDDFWSSDISDLKDYGAENKKISRYVLVIIDNFSQFSWTGPLKIKSAQTMKNSFENVLKTSKGKPN